MSQGGAEPESTVAPSVDAEAHPQHHGQASEAQLRRRRKRGKRSRLGWDNILDDAQDRYNQTKEEVETNILELLNRRKFDGLLFFVAGSGFLTDSYNLFVTNVAVPAITFVYFNGDNAEAKTFELAINLATLVGAIVGQIFFGLLADRYGRTSLYGIELVIVIMSTFGFAFGSQGFVALGMSNVLNIKVLFCCWRFIMGVGIGAEYPLSAVLTAEWASDDYRGQMLAAVFAMQPFGQLCAYAASWIAARIVYSGDSWQYHLSRIGNATNLSSQAALEAIRGSNSTLLSSEQAFHLMSAQNIADRAWRGVVGFGAIPAAVAIIFRFFITDPGRYTLQVQDDIDRAVDDTQDRAEMRSWRFWQLLPEPKPRSPPSQEPAGAEMQVLSPDGQGTQPRSQDPPPDGRSLSSQEHAEHPSPVNNVATMGSNETPPGPQSTAQTRYREQSWKDFHRYVFDENNIILLLGTCGCWFLLDVAFFGLGINSPHNLDLVWAKQFPDGNRGHPQDPPNWNQDPIHPDASVYTILNDNAFRLICTSAIGSFVGSLVLILFINKINRKTLLAYSFLILGGFLLASGIGFRFTSGHPSFPLTVVFYAICQFLFNFGPNTLTFIIPAEIFPTRYRCLCHGLSAASGKLGSVFIQLILWGVFRSRPDDMGGQIKAFSWVLIGFSFVMALGFPLTLMCIPEVQRRVMVGNKRQLQTKSLEELAPGMVVMGTQEDLGLDRARQWPRMWRRWMSFGR